VATLWGLLDRRRRVVGAPRSQYKDALSILYLDSAFTLHFDNNISNYIMYSNIIIKMNAKGTVIYVLLN